MNKKQLSARAKKAWATRKRGAIEVIERVNTRVAKLHRHEAATKAWATRRLNGQAKPVQTIDGEIFFKKINRHLAAVKAWETRRGE